MMKRFYPQKLFCLQKLFWTFWVYLIFYKKALRAVVFLKAMTSVIRKRLITFYFKYFLLKELQSQILRIILVWLLFCFNTGLSTIIFIISWDSLVLPNFPFATSEMIRDYCLLTWYMRVASQVAEQLKTSKMSKFQFPCKNQKVVNISKKLPKYSN